jgi:23S rRNA (pseudouridine1915-N3)-methyltransferase
MTEHKRQMEIFILQIGRTRATFLHDGLEEYLKRLKQHAKISIIDIKEINKKLPPEQQIEQEGEVIKEKILKLPFNTTKVGLAIEGKSISSSHLAHFIEEQRDQSKHLCFIIGGPFGLAEDVKRKCDVLLSFSAFTFTHEIIRLLLLEQIYRAFTIIEHKPYHY